MLLVCLFLVIRRSQSCTLCSLSRYFSLLSDFNISLPESNLEPINEVVLFESVDETLVCDHSNGSY